MIIILQLSKKQSCWTIIAFKQIPKQANVIYFCITDFFSLKGQGNIAGIAALELPSPRDPEREPLSELRQMPDGADSIVCEAEPGQDMTVKEIRPTSIHIHIAIGNK